MTARLAAIAAAGGRLALLTGTIASPAAGRLIEELLRRFPGALHAVHDPVSLAALRRANDLCFGRPVVPRFRFDRARVIVGIEADFLGSWLSPVEFARQYADGRRPGGAAPMARHYQFESGLSLTGSNADRRAAVLPSELGLVALALAGRLARLGPGMPIPGPRFLRSRHPASRRSSTPWPTTSGPTAANRWWSAASTIRRCRWRSTGSTRGSAISAPTARSTSTGRPGSARGTTAR